MLSALLAEREKKGKPIKVGIIGTGKFGGGLVTQIARMKGMTVSAIADIKPENARYAYAAAYGDVAVGSADSQQALEGAIHAGRFAVVEDGLLVAEAEGLDVVVEATGLTDVGAKMASATIAAGNHLVMVNVETDVTIGALLRRKADRAGVVYSLVDGDQPGVTMNIIEWAWSLGFEIVAAGRGTELFASDPAGTPDSVPERYGFDEETLQRRTINLKMYNSFRDGTKAQVEATAIAKENRLVVVDLPANVKNVRALIKQLDQPRPQVRITALIYDASLEDIERIGNVTRAGATALSLGNLQAVGIAMNECHRLLQGLGVSDDDLDRMVDAALPSSLGAKLTGAGGGGCMIALTTEPQRTAEAIELAGGRTMVSRLGAPGVRIENE